MHKLNQSELQLDQSKLPNLEYLGPIWQEAAQPNIGKPFNFQNRNNGKPIFSNVLLRFHHIHNHRERAGRGQHWRKKGDWSFTFLEIQSSLLFEMSS